MKNSLHNHDRIKEAVSSKLGQVLKTEKIRALCRRRFPNMPDGSILPNDHAEGNESACRCAKTPTRLFDKVRHAHYRVR